MDIVYEICKELYNIKSYNTKSRVTELVLFRAAVSFFCYKYCDVSKSQIARFLNKNHASTMNAIKKYKETYINHIDFLPSSGLKVSMLHTKIDEKLSAIFDQEKYKELNTQDREMVYLRKQNSILQKQVDKFNRLKKSPVPKKIIDLWAVMNEKEKSDFLNFKVEPKLRMISADKKRRDAYFPMLSVTNGNA